MDESKKQTICRMSIFMIWLIVLMPVYSANALEVVFNPNADITVTHNSATISWTSDEPSTGIVSFGLNELIESESVEIPRTEQSITVDKIPSESSFNYVLSVSSAGESQRFPEEAGQVNTFTTLPAPDQTGPDPVEGLSAPDIGKDEITLQWEASTAEDFQYYRVYRDGEMISDNLGDTTYTDTGLNTSMQYDYGIAAVDTTGNEGDKATVSATTKSESYKEIMISGPTIEVLGVNALVKWTTDTPSHSRVKYSQTSVLDQTKEDPEMVTSHNMTITGLVENSNYSYMVESCDDLGNCGASEIKNFSTGKKVDIFLEVNGWDCTPDTYMYANSDRYDVKGLSSPGADVTLYVNGELQRYKRVGENGEFNFVGVNLDGDREENIIRLETTDYTITKECEEKILIDYFSPEVDFTNETLNTTFSADASFNIAGNLTDDNPVTMYVYVTSLTDTTPPPTPENLQNGTVGIESIELTWEIPEEAVEGAGVEEDEETTGAYDGDVTTSTEALDDLDLFLIYRSDVPDGPIAYVSGSEFSYVDNNVTPKTSYTYRVSAIDEAGNEGDLSVAYTITTLEGNATKNVTKPTKVVPPSKSLRATKEFQPNGQTMLFNERASDLFDGENQVRVVFVDIAGNEFEQQFNIFYDREPPKIISPTASELGARYSPAYVSELMLRGQINKPVGEIWIWVNSNAEKPTYKVSTGENGTFEAEVAISDSLAAGVFGNVEPGATSMGGGASVSGPSTVDAGEGTTNTIKLVAVDPHGRESAPVEGTIIYTPCGLGYDWTVELKHTGNIINTREIVEGMAAYGFGFALDWNGATSDGGATAQKVRVTPAAMGEQFQKKYDNDWLAGNPTVMCDPRNCTDGFVLINFAPQPVQDGETYFDRENNISKHRWNECGMPGGCIRLLLELEIPYQTASYGNTGASYTGNAGGYDTGSANYGGSIDAGVGGYDSSGSYSGAYSGAQYTPSTQKQCVEVFINIDQRIDPSDIPKDLLKSLIKAINATITFLDMIEKPIRYTTYITIAFCLLTYLSKFIVDAFRSYNCKFTGTLGNLMEGNVMGLASTIKGGGIEQIAKMTHLEDSANNACEIEFGGGKGGSQDSDQEALKSACTECAQWWEKSRWITDKWHLFCDRVICPGVPTFQHYINSQWRAGQNERWSEKDGSRPGSVTYDEVVTYEEYTSAGSSEGSKGQQLQWLSNFKYTESDCAFAELGKGPVGEMYHFYEDHDEDEIAKLCQGGHVPQAACCPYEYMYEWGWGMMFNNELELSYCLAAPEADECGFGTDIVNGVTGICQPKGKEPKAIHVELDYLNYNSEAEGCDVPAREKQTYKHIPNYVSYKINIDESGSAAEIIRGYIGETEISSGFAGEQEADGRIEISTGNYFHPATAAYPITELCAELHNDDISKEDPDGNKKLETGQSGYRLLKQDLEKALGSDLNGNCLIRTDGKKVSGKAALTTPIAGEDPVEHWAKQICGQLGDPGRQYLAQPAGSFVQSLITLCLAGILSWMIQFRNMLFLLMQCFQTILVTGDGSSGQCQAIISQYICDLLYEVISCFINRFGGGGSRGIGRGGIGGVFGAISDSGKNIQSETLARYGDDNMFTNVFSAENLIHDACIWLFTGEWPTDWKSLFEQAATIPINTTALVFPATRRWQAYDPTTGFSRYVYRIGYSVFAGADIQYFLQLECSQSGMCTDGNGNTDYCDCAQPQALASDSYGANNRIGEFVKNIPTHQTGDCPENGQLKQGAFCSDEVMFIAAGTGTPLRYDKAVVSWKPTKSLKPGFQGNMADPAAVTGRSEMKINEIAGPYEGLCEFNVGKAAYLCGYKVPDSGYARFIGDPVAINAEKAAQQVKYSSAAEAYEPYTVGDNLLVKAFIENQLPPNLDSCGSQDCAHTKYLVIKEITNGKGAKIYPPETQGALYVERLNENTAYEFQVFDPLQFKAHTVGYGPFVIKESDFSSSGVSGTGCNVMSGTLRSQLLGAIECSLTGTKAMKIEKNKDTLEVRYTTGTIDAQTKKFESEGESTICGTIDGEQTNPKITCGEITLTFKNQEKEKYSDISGDLLVVAKTQEATTAGTTCSKEIEEWKVTLQLRGVQALDGGGFTISSMPLVDYETGVTQEKIVPIKVVCDGSGRPASYDEATIEDLAAITATVTVANDQYNKTYGLWTDPAKMGPTEVIRAGSFRWISTTGKKSDGFILEVSSTSTVPVPLYIDVGDIGLIPQDHLKVIKGEDQVLKMCVETNDQPPCIGSKGDVNNRYVVIWLQEGDPPFRFEGFSSASGEETLLGGEVVINSKNKYALNERVGYSGPEGYDIILSDYMEYDDHFTFYYKTEPANFVEPAGFAFNMKGKYQFDAETVKVGDLPRCEDVDERTQCFYTNDNGISIRTLGTGGISKFVEVTGLTKLQYSEESSILDANGKTIVLTKQNPTQYGINASIEGDSDKVTLSTIGVSDSTKSITFSYQTDIAAGTTLSFNLDGSGLQWWDTDGSHIIQAGVAEPLAECGVAPCIAGTTEPAKIVLQMPKMSSGEIFVIKGLTGDFTASDSSGSGTGTVSGNKDGAVSSLAGVGSNCGQSANVGYKCFEPGTCDPTTIIGDNTDGMSTPEDYDVYYSEEQTSSINPELANPFVHCQEGLICCKPYADGIPEGGQCYSQTSTGLKGTCRSTADCGSAGGVSFAPGTSQTDSCGEGLRCCVPKFQCYYPANEEGTNFYNTVAGNTMHSGYQIFAYDGKAASTVTGVGQMHYCIKGISDSLSSGKYGVWFDEGTSTFLQKYVCANLKCDVNCPESVAESCMANGALLSSAAACWEKTDQEEAENSAYPINPAKYFTSLTREFKCGDGVEKEYSIPGKLYSTISMSFVDEWSAKHKKELCVYYSQQASFFNQLIQSASPGSWPYQACSYCYDNAGVCLNSPFCPPDSCT